MSSILDKCNKLGLKMTEQRRVIVQVLSESKDHPDVELVYKRASSIDKNIGIATVYRTIKLFEESGILIRHDFKEGKSRYEPITEEHHNHLIDINTGEIVEFVDKDIGALQSKIAQKLGYKLVDHKLELYGSKIKKN